MESIESYGHSAGLRSLNQALDARGRPSGVIHHSDKGSQYLSIKYGERLKQSGLAASVGTTGDSYDNALAESVNGLYKAEVIDYLKQEWDGVNDVALATLDWVHWYNYERLHSTNGYVSPERGLAKHCFARVQDGELCS